MEANQQLLEQAKKMQEGAMAMAKLLPSIIENFAKNLTKEGAESFAKGLKDIENINAANKQLNDLLKNK